MYVFYSSCVPVSPISSFGRAANLQAEGRSFEPRIGIFIFCLILHCQRFFIIEVQQPNFWSSYTGYTNNTEMKLFRVSVQTKIHLISYVGCRMRLLITQSLYI